jgi:hypothetical protein
MKGDARSYDISPAFGEATVELSDPDAANERERIIARARGGWCDSFRYIALYSPPRGSAMAQITCKRAVSIARIVSARFHALRAIGGRRIVLRASRDIARKAFA